MMIGKLPASLVSLSGMLIATLSPEASPTPTPFVPYTEPPYTPVQPDGTMIALYLGIALLIAAAGIGVYFFLKNKKADEPAPPDAGKEE